MKKPVPENRRNPLFFEKDGDFNPGYALFIASWCIGMVGAVVCFAAALLNPERAWPAALGALSFIAFSMLLDAFIVVPIARAKLLAPSIKGAVEGISHAAAGAGGRLAGVDVRFTDDERGEP